MNFYQIVGKAFSGRSKPMRLIELKHSITPEQRDALWFTGRDWVELTWKDWEQHADALYAFTPEAFVYYLPSVLSLSSERPDCWFAPANAVIQIIDRSPNVEYWDEFLVRRLTGLKPLEYEALKQWLLLISENSVNASAEAIDRAFDTVILLERETAKTNGADKNGIDS